jgi:hypothetical protein
MLKVIDDETLIRKYAKLFARRLRSFADETIKVKLGHQGASFTARIRWSRRLGLWSFSRPSPGVRWANFFGTEKPAPGISLAITTEINFPWSGVDRKTGAAFARDIWNNVYVVHRGRIGGGKKGVGKSLFEENYRGVGTWMEDQDTRAQVAVVGALSSPRFALQAALFVRKIDRLKSRVSSSLQTSLNFQDVSFREAFIGYGPACPICDRLSEACDHDLILSHLAMLLKRWKYKVGNDADRELFVMSQAHQRVSHVFAVPTDSTSRSVLAKAAELLLWKTAEGDGVTAVLVIQEDQLIQYVQAMERLGVIPLPYRMEGERIVFSDLRKIRLDPNGRV